MHCRMAVLRMVLMQGRCVVVRLCCELGKTMRPRGRIALRGGILLVVGCSILAGHRVQVRVNGLWLVQQRAVSCVMRIVVIIAML